MNTKMALRWAMSLMVLGSTWAFAQGQGRTDGPEGSEYGKGGYQPAPSASVAGNGGRVSLAFNGGASLYRPAPLSGTGLNVPLFAGATVSFWADDWFLIDLSGAHLFNAQRTQFLIGPRFRTPTWRISGYAGLQAGAMFDATNGLLFGLSPNVGGDLLLTDNWLLGLGYALDIPIGGGSTASRLSLNLGYRF
jgi:hypothetical protein